MSKDEVIFALKLYPKEEPIRTAGGLSIAAEFPMQNDCKVRNVESFLKDSIIGPPAHTFHSAVLRSIGIED